MPLNDLYRNGETFSPGEWKEVCKRWDAYPKLVQFVKAVESLSTDEFVSHELCYEALQLLQELGEL